MVLPATICVKMIRLLVIALVDSGAEKNLISMDFLEQLLIQELTQPLVVAAITGQTITSISHWISSLHLVFSGNHHEEGMLYIFNSVIRFEYPD